MKKVNHEENKVNNEELKEEINQDIPNTEETQEPDCGQRRPKQRQKPERKLPRPPKRRPKFLQRRKR